MGFVSLQCITPKYMLICTINPRLLANRRSNLTLACLDPPEYHHISKTTVQSEFDHRCDENQMVDTYQDMAHTFKL